MTSGTSDCRNSAAFAGAPRFRKAAEQGYGEAQHMLGGMYGKGQGVPQDYVQAHKWYNLAALRLPTGKSRDLAAKIRDLLTEHMTPAQVTEAHRLAREWLAKFEERKKR